MEKKKPGFDVINTPACGLDVHKDVIEACVIDEDGERHLKTFDTMRRTLYAARDWILSFNCFYVLMESTSVYWIPIFEVLEEVTGMDVGVGNSRHMKKVPGRPKTDKDDSKWIARLCSVGLILKSFVVGKKFRELREYTRYHKKLVQDRARHVNRIEKLLQLNGFKLSSVFSDITGVTALNLLKKLRDKGSVTLEEVTAALVYWVKKSPEEIEQAINGKMKLTSRLLLGKMLSRLDTCDKEIAAIYDMMAKMSKEHEPQIRIIDSIPGLAELSAMYIIAEISTDLSSFETANHITAWAGLAPKDNESGGKLKSSKTKKANIYIKSVLTECAWAVTKTKNTRLSNWYWSNVNRLGKKKAIIAVARKLLVYIYAMLKSGEMYDDSLDVADTEKRKAHKLESARKLVDNQSCESTNEQQGIDQGVVATKKTRDPDESDLDPAKKTESAGTTTKRRGRPKKVVDGTSSDDKPIADSPKKRGRPRKETAIDDLSSGEIKKRKPKPEMG
jgi:transposase